MHTHAEIGVAGTSIHYATAGSGPVTEREGDIRAPTLVVCGAEDELTPPKYSEFLHARIGFLSR